MLGKVALEPSWVGAVRCTPLKFEYSLTKALPGSGMPLVSRTLTTTVTGLSIKLGAGPRPLGVGRCAKSAPALKKHRGKSTYTRENHLDGTGVTCSAMQVPAEGKRLRQR